MEGEKSQRVRWQWIAAIFGLAIICRLVLLLSMGRLDGDAVIWVFPAAEALGNGEWAKGFHPAIPPLYPILVALGRLIVGDVEIGARAASLVGGVLAGVPLFLLVRRSFGDRVGIAAIFLLAIHPFFSRSSVLARADTIGAFFFVTSAWLAWRLLQEPSARSGVALGIVSGLGFLVRPKGIILPILAILWLAASRKTGASKIRLAGVVGTVAPLAAILLLQSLWIHHRTGVWTITPKLAVNLEYGEGRADGRSWWSLTEDGEEVALFRQIEEGEYSAGGAALRALSNPVATVKRVGANIGRFLAYLPDLIGYPNLLLLPLCVAGFRDPERRPMLVFLLAVIGFYFAALALFHPARRMIVLPIPLAVVFPAMGLARLSEWASGARRAGAMRGLVWGVVLAATLPFLGRTFVKYGGWWSPLRVASSFVRAGTEDDHRARIMAFPADLGFFAGGKTVFFPRDTYERTLRYARLHGVQYIAYEVGMAKEDRPEFEALAKEDADLDPMGRISGPVTIHLYRLKER
ncbi:MAG: glycosyltransferase family 39 protein [Planctomycetota bacterium]|nr:glycosyltransferase family 39 protein [Planctomycetota bacterium]